ncbi:Scopoletin glucosyltransferase [Vigna angularis]|uniref:Scopoletin glucosyltransferase n=1 Tax=Phaseolus angularis TaxID=3914 RepID=A0A8T0JM45_PHAAN|nr:Scopoletin glucosyltransferase [Vigna angularis]
MVYICFGSLCHFPDKQLYEIACGMEASGHGFIWVVLKKKGKEESEEEKEKWMPEGFEERNAEKWMVIRGWAPHLIILNHAVGAFLSHCGWNSTVEAEWWRPHDYLVGARRTVLQREADKRGAGNWSGGGHNIVELLGAE